MEEDQVNSDKLRQLRQARGWDWEHIARLSSLSVSQVKELEEGGSACFYSVSIKNNAARKVAQILGVSEAEVITVREVPVAVQEELLPTAHITVPALNGASNLKPTPYLSTWMGYGVMSLLLVVGLSWYSLRPMKSPSAPARMMTAVSDPVPETVSSESNTVSPAASLNSALPVNQVLAASAPMMPSPTSPQVPVKPDTSETELRPASLLASADQTCPFDGDVAPLEVENPSKSSDKVSVMFRKVDVVCVQDSTGKVWRESIQPWTLRTFTGKAPWKLHSAALPSADVFFQGKKMPVAAVQSHTISLSAKPVIR